MIKVTCAALLLIAVSTQNAQAAYLVKRIDYVGDVHDRQRLEYLTTLDIGAPYDPIRIRQTLDYFYQTGRYQDITVDRSQEGDGEKVTFQFKRRSRLTDWQFFGNQHIDSETLVRAAGLQWGQSFDHKKMDKVSRVIAERYLREGYPFAQATAKAETASDGTTRLLVTVKEGEPIRVEDVQFQVSGGADRLPGIERSFQLKKGDVLRREALLKGMEQVESLLSESGFLNGRASFSFDLPGGSHETSFNEVMRSKADRVRLRIAIEVGQRSQVSVVGSPLLPLHDLAEAITVFKNRSYSPYELDECSERLRRLYVSQGYLNAVVGSEILKDKDGTYRIQFNVQPGKAVTLRSIQFQGNEGISGPTLLKQLNTHAGDFWKAGIFDPDVWNNDIANLLDYYASLGYLDAKIETVRRELDDSDSAMNLQVQIHEGARSLISRIRVSGVDPIQEAGILQALPIDPGSAYNSRRLPEWISSVQAYFAKSGFPLARVTASYEKADATGSQILGTLHFDIDPGPYKRIGKTVLRGPIRTSEAVILKQLKLQLGKPYNAEDLYADQQRIYQLGFFDRVTVEPLRPITTNPDEAVDLLVDVRERESGWFSLGAGYNGIGSLQGPEVSGEYVQNNLGGTGRPLRIEGAFGPSRTVGTFTLRDPDWLGANLVGETGFSYRDEYQTVTRRVESWGPSFGLSKQITQRLLGTLRYSWTQVAYKQATAEDIVSANGLSKRTDSMLTAGLTSDARSDTLNPRWGNRWEIYADVSAPFLNSSITYARPRAMFAQYFPFPRKIVVALEAEGSYIQPLGNTGVLPNDLKFLAGGTNLRGYGYNSVGIPSTDATACTNIGKTACVSGGNILLLGHAEVRIPVTGDAGGVLFLDAGNVWNQPDQIRPESILVTGGMGLRYQTPVGPIRLDYGLRIKPVPELTGLEGLTFGIGQVF